MPSDADNMVIEQLLESQQQVIEDLDQLNEQILSVIEAIAAQRKSEQAPRVQNPDDVQSPSSEAA